ncbi:MAG: hypothetical protein K940chlam7_01529 [Chlamydiae bacterium]|nr:hypothetical protein [Chlamydiota bacterium]
MSDSRINIQFHLENSEPDLWEKVGYFCSKMSHEAFGHRKVTPSSGQNNATIEKVKASAIKIFLFLLTLPVSVSITIIGAICLSASKTHEEKHQNIFHLLDDVTDDELIDHLSGLDKAEQQIRIESRIRNFQAPEQQNMFFESLLKEHSRLSIPQNELIDIMLNSQPRSLEDRLDLANLIAQQDESYAVVLVASIEKFEIKDATPKQCIRLATLIATKGQKAIALVKENRDKFKLDEADSTDRTKLSFLFFTEHAPKAPAKPPGPTNPPPAGTPPAIRNGYIASSPVPPAKIKQAEIKQADMETAIKRFCEITSESIFLTDMNSQLKVMKLPGFLENFIKEDHKNLKNLKKKIKSFVNKFKEIPGQIKNIFAGVATVEMENIIESGLPKKKMTIVVKDHITIEDIERIAEKFGNFFLGTDFQNYFNALKEIHSFEQWYRNALNNEIDTQKCEGKLREWLIHSSDTNVFEVTPAALAGQRIMRYGLLLKDTSQDCSKMHMDTQTLKRALEKVTSLNESYNREKDILDCKDCIKRYKPIAPIRLEINNIQVKINGKIKEIKEKLVEAVNPDKAVSNDTVNQKWDRTRLQFEAAKELLEKKEKLVNKKNNLLEKEEELLGKDPSLLKDIYSLVREKYLKIPDVESERLDLYRQLITINEMYRLKDMREQMEKLEDGESPTPREKSQLEGERKKCNSVLELWELENENLKKEIEAARDQATTLLEKFKTAR